MTSYDYDIAVIGGGAAGLTVAAGSSRIGAKTLIIEKAPELGGDCLHFGCVPSKTLIEIAKVRHFMANASMYGLPGVELAQVDFSKVRDRIKQVIDTIQRHDSVERFCRLGARVEFGNPEFVDDHSVKLDGRHISARIWVIATGSSPGVPPFKGIEKVGYWTNKDIFFLDRLPSSMIVLGAGPIAIEMAQAFNRLGTKTTVVQRSGQILSKEDKDMADMVQESLEAEGVLFHLNSTVESVYEDSQGRKKVRIKKKGALDQMEIGAKALLVAMGRQPNVDTLSLGKAGVEFTPKGILVDHRMRTSTKHIYAAGDVTGRYLFTHAAGYEAGIVVTNAIFHVPKKADYRFMPWCTYSQPELASIGVNEKRAKEMGIDYSLWQEPFSENDRAIASFSPVGKVKLILGKNGKPIGCQIVGPNAGEIMGHWVAAFASRTSIATVASAVHPYPTVSEINKKIAGRIMAQKIFSKPVKKGLQFFFGLKGRACMPEQEA